MVVQEVVDQLVADSFAVVLKEVGLMEPDPLEVDLKVVDSFVVVLKAVVP